ncbi:unnamed protein product [Adineta steineri]|uniref:Uncharacterized protein n=1 Tax=Adineta steineri TaxID=433720 RepID=A0A820EBY5_9BILA|nr:unnamed protein product [Adineta steineri]
MYPIVLEPPSNSPDLKIILPIVLTLAFAVVIITIGLFYYRRRLRNKKSEKHSPNISVSRAAQLSDNQHVPIYSVDPIKLDTDHGYAIWRPIQQKT